MQDEILRRLAELGPNRSTTPSEIAAALKLARSTVHEQLGFLTRKGYVRGERGNYAITESGMGHFVGVKGARAARKGTIYVDGIRVRKGQRLLVSGVKQVFDPGCMVIVRHSQIPGYLDDYRDLGVVYKPRKLNGYALLLWSGP